MEQDEENKRSHRVCELCARLIIGDREWAGGALTGHRGAPGRAELLWGAGAAALWPDDPQLMILASQGLFAVPQEPSVRIPSCPGLPSLPSTQKTHTASHQGSVCAIKLRAAVFSQGSWSFTALWMLLQKAQSKSPSSKVLLCK